MRLKIVQAGEPVLRQKARSLGAEEIRSGRIQQLIELMRETMQDAPGVGLAAPQVGEPLQIAVIEDKSEYMSKLTPDALAQRERTPVPFHVIINPQLTIEGDEAANFHEGCLSIPGFVARVNRARHVTVQCLDGAGSARTIHAHGWYARILQHEIDHLNGSLYIDRMNTKSFASVDNHSRFGDR